MKNDFANKWEEISDIGHGAGRFRVFPDHLLDLFLGFSTTCEREFTLEFSALNISKIEMPVFENILVYLKSEGDTHGLTLRLTDHALKDLFSIMCTDLAESSSRAKSSLLAVDVFIVRLSRWAELLRRRKSHGMSFEERLGLLGELCMLTWLMDRSGIDFSVILSGWRGPDGDSSDIGLNGVRIEVKAQLSTQSAALRVSSLSQLDGDDGNIFVALHRFSVAEEGLSLKSLIDRIDAKLVRPHSALLDFRRKLMFVGYDHDATYVEENFVLDELMVYRVGETFPRLTPNNVSDGISCVSYKIDCGAVKDFRISQEDLEDLIND
ncbi:PD-(D/E)XK motif protein [Pseudomonas sp. IT-P44]|uniref:PD-(D/E)XK motif protein n=1 Tax=Pseudomonas sp. IT-P44 TaxID=3026451 RepID=UPI0039DF8CAB